MIIQSGKQAMEQPMPMLQVPILPLTAHRSLENKKFHKTNPTLTIQMRIEQAIYYVKSAIS